MTLHAYFLGAVYLPDLVEPRAPRHRPDGVRIVRRPAPMRPETRS